MGEILDKTVVSSEESLSQVSRNDGKVVSDDNDLIHYKSSWKLLKGVSLGFGIVMVLLFVIPGIVMHNFEYIKWGFGIFIICSIGIGYIFYKEKKIFGNDKNIEK